MRRPRCCKAYSTPDSPSPSARCPFTSSTDSFESTIRSRRCPTTELLVEFDRLDRFIRIDRDERHVTLQETVRKLARGLAHEIKNPLGGLRGAAQLLDRQLANDEQREYTSVIISEADRLRNLVDRIMGPNGEVTFEPVNVHHVIERVVKLLEAESPAEVRFERSYDVSLPDVEADFERLVQATLNVLGNATLALKDTPDPCIRLETRVVRQFTIGPNRSSSGRQRRFHRQRAWRPRRTSRTGSSTR